MTPCVEKITYMGVICMLVKVRRRYRRKEKDNGQELPLWSEIRKKEF